MKTTLLLSLATLLSLPAAVARDTFTLSGRINGMNNGKIYLDYMTAWARYARDSAIIVDGRFSFRGEIDGATTAALHLSPVVKNNNDPNLATFWIEATTMRVELTTGDFKNYRLEGSPTDDDARALAARVEQEPANDNTTRATSRDIPLRHAREHPDSYLSAFHLFTRVSSLPPEEAREIHDAFTPRVKASVFGKEAGNEIRKIENGSPGHVAALFKKAEDIRGNPFDLAALVGKKYILIDFWASWCVPCRQGNPHLKQLHERYRDDLFVVCISDDDSAPAKWRSAVEQDGLHDFYHLLRGLKRTPTGFNRDEDINELYGIHALPTKILIDKQGIIIGRYVGDSTGLDEQLATLFNK